jgi:ssDNA thymidine ADP-ribosyltransferase, DarT
MMPNPVRLFHITAIENLAAICQRGALVSKNAGATQGINYQNIAHAGAQNARAGKPVPNPPGGNIHDFVPFYFAPRSPMLSAIHNDTVVGCSLKQSDIVHLETTVQHVSANNAECVFYDRNATKSYSVAFTDLSRLPTEIAWDLITEPPQLDGYCKYFFDRPMLEKYVDRMERRQAEFLVKNAVALSAMTRIGVINSAKAEWVREVLAASGVNLLVEVKTDWYFLGQ